jgi:hypothetical protein
LKRERASALHPSGGGGASRLSRDFRGGGQSHGESVWTPIYMQSVARLPSH